MKKLIILASIITLSISVYSQDSLMVYLELAAKNNPSVQQKFTEYQAALQKVPQVGSLPDPELNVGVFLSPMELVAGKQVADIRLMQMFPWFGVLKNAKDEMIPMAIPMFGGMVIQVMTVFVVPMFQSMWRENAVKIGTTQRHEDTKEL